MFQAYSVRTKDGEDTRAVGTRHRSCHQQCQPDRHRRYRIEPTEKKINHHAGDSTSNHYPQGCKSDTGQENGLYIAEFGLQTTRKQDDTHRYGTQRLRCIGLDLDTAGSHQFSDCMRTKKHTDRQKEQQSRYAVFIPYLVRKNANEE